MPAITLPQGTIVAPPHPFTRKAMEMTMGDLCEPARDFTGFIAVTAGSTQFLLFFFRSRPYSAGKFIGEKPFSLSIHDFFRELGQITDPAPSFSIHATDPVLLKCLLVFIQDNLAVKAPTSLINLEAILEQIQQEAADALIILEKQGMFNFYFFKDGVKGKSYCTDQDAAGNENLPIDEQMLVYAFGSKEVSALVYRNMATHESTDAEMLAPDDIPALLDGVEGGDSKTAIAADVQEAEIIEENLALSIVGGPHQGKILTGPIPCVLGRKGADIIIPDPMVSKSHADLRVIGNDTVLTDLKSTNGTTVNGQRITQRNIMPGDIIGMGGIHLKVLRITRP